jgi:hypothetical protein
MEMCHSAAALRIWAPETLGCSDMAATCAFFRQVAIIFSSWLPLVE